MKQRLISIFLLSVFLICSLMPGASAGAPAFDEGALSQYLNAWQQQYTAENFRESSEQTCSMYGGEKGATPTNFVAL